jgi:hypothetical protein
MCTKPCLAFLFFTFYLNAMAADLKYDVAQLHHFLTDRPKAAAILNGNAVLEQWLTEAFSGAWTNGRQLVWESDEPGGSARSSVHDSGNIFSIRVSAQLGGVDQLSALIFESVNAKGLPEISELNYRAHMHTISRDEYIDDILKHEHHAMVEVKDLLGQFLPLSKDQIAKTEIYRIAIDVPESFSEFPAYLASKHHSISVARKVYGDEYDALSSTSSAK